MIRGMSIRYKIVALIFIVSFSVMVTGIAVGYSNAFVLLRDSIGGNYVSMARILARSFDRNIDELVLDLTIYMSHSECRVAVESSNQKYENMESDQLENYFIQMDKKWVMLSNIY